MSAEDLARWDIALIEQRRGGVIYRVFRLRFGARALLVEILEQPDGIFEQYMVEPTQ